MKTTGSYTPPAISVCRERVQQIKRRISSVTGPDGLFEVQHILKDIAEVLDAMSYMEYARQVNTREWIPPKQNDEEAIRTPDRKAIAEALSQTQPLKEREEQYK